MIFDNIIVRRGQLHGPVSDLPRDVLIEVKAPRGRRRFILFFKEVYGTVLEMEQTSATAHSTNFKQSYLLIGTTVVGSLIEISSKWCTTTRMSVGYMPPQEKLYDFDCPVEGQSGGVLVYTDSHGSFFAVISNAPDSPILIKDQKDQ